MPGCILGIDSSTTSCKTIAWDARGNALGVGRAPLSMARPRPGWHEQNAEDWWQALVTALRDLGKQVDLGSVEALCITAQRETFVLVDAAGMPVYPALVWMDERARDLLQELDRRYGAERVHQDCGKPLSANLSIAKLFWLHRHAPEACQQAAYALDVHAFLAHRLVGRFATSWGCADPTGLFHMPAARWNEGLLDAAGWPVAKLPEALPVGAVVGTITPAAAQATGLPRGIPLIAGLGDGQAAGLGVGITAQGDAYLNLGTAVVSGTFSAAYRVDRAFRTHFSGAPGPDGGAAYLMETVLLGGTYTINWLLEQFQPAGGLPALETAASALPPGAEGLVLVPYWNTAMNPYWDASASGVTIGWRGIHGPAHLYRAILEGIALEQRLATEGVEAALEQPVARFVAVGGGAQSGLWRQIVASCTGKPVVTADTTEASALGAGMLAAVGASWYPDPQAAAHAMRGTLSTPVLPDPDQQAFYTRLYQEVYAPLYPTLRETLRRLAAF